MEKIIHTTKTILNGGKLAGLVEAFIAEQTDSEILACASTPQGQKQGKLAKVILSGDSAKRLNQIQFDHGTPAKALIDAMIAKLEKKSDTKADEDSDEVTPMARWLKHSGRKPRDGQDLFYDNVFKSLTNGKVGLCEASTGSGKTTAILSAAADAIKGKGTRSLIATPAVALVRDFAIEHSRLGEDVPPLRVFLGQREFVSELELFEFLSEWVGFEDQITAVHEWIAKGAPSVETGLTQCYLKHTLRLIAPNLPVEEVLVKEDTDELDAGMVAYRKQFHRDEDGPKEEILLCSHAMLAFNLRRRLYVAAKSGDLTESRKKIDAGWTAAKKNKAQKISNAEVLEQIKLAQQEHDEAAINASAGCGRLPDFSYLVIDEAHLLEQSFSNSLSSYVAIHQFMQHARTLANAGLLTKKASKAIESAYYQLVAAAKSEKEDTIQIANESQTVLAPLLSIAEAAKDAIDRITPKRMATISPENLSLIKSFRADLACINQAANFSAGHIAYITLSPRLAYPRLFVGKSSVDQYLRFLWASVQGAACVSATLYLPSREGFSAWYMQSILAIPTERSQEYDPVQPAWIRDTVQEVIMPKSTVVDGRTKLCPLPRKTSEPKKEEGEDLWCKDVAEEVTKIYETAAGGCLVLMTSYTHVNKVKALLMENPDIAPNLVFAQQGSEKVTKAKGKKLQAITINEQQRHYLRLAFEGKKPIWLALGNAWTGINLSGGDPMKELFGTEIASDKDNVLTDLIIPRLPFGVNKSITHTYRIKHKAKINWDMIDTILRFKQGVGRLVRRHGVPKNRRIHVLDARLCEGGSCAHMWASVKKAAGISDS